MRPTPGGWISADFDPWVENRGLIDWVVATTTDLHPAYRCVHPHIRGSHTRALPRFRGSPTQGDSCGSGDRHTRGDSCGSGDPTPGALTLPRFRGSPNPGRLLRFRGSLHLAGFLRFRGPPHLGRSRSSGRRHIQHQVVVRLGRPLPGPALGGPSALDLQVLPVVLSGRSHLASAVERRARPAWTVAVPPSGSGIAASFPGRGDLCQGSNLFDPRRGRRRRP